MGMEILINAKVYISGNCSFHNPTVQTLTSSETDAERFYIEVNGQKYFQNLSQTEQILDSNNAGSTTTSLNKKGLRPCATEDIDELYYSFRLPINLFNDDNEFNEEPKTSE